MHAHAHEKKFVLAVVLAAALTGVVVYAKRDPRPAPQPQSEARAEERVPPGSVQETPVTPAPPAEELQPAEGETRYHIGAGTKASFSINEVLRGSPFTVVGTTEDVTGDIALNMADGAKSRIGTIAIDARTLQTDNKNRNGMIARFILRSGDAGNEYITFKPSAIDGLPATLTEGAPFDFSITGDLTISGVTRTVTFNAAAQLAPGDKLVGKADTTILYKDFGITIPQVPFVAAVDDDLKLSIELVAVKG